MSAALRRGSDLTRAAAGAVLEQRMAAEEAAAAGAAAAFFPSRGHTVNAPQGTITRPPMLRLDGHEGSIHRYGAQGSGLGRQK